MGESWECMSIKFANVVEKREWRVSYDVRGVPFLRLDCLVHSLYNCAMTLPTETGLVVILFRCCVVHVYKRAHPINTDVASSITSLLRNT